MGGSRKRKSAMRGVGWGTLALLGALVYLVLPNVHSSAYADDGAPDTAAPRAHRKHKYRHSRLTRDEQEANADHRTLLLATGEDKAVELTFDLPSHDAVVEGNKTVVAVQTVRIDGKTQLVFKPLKAGETTVTVRDVDGLLRLIFTVRVTGSNLLNIASEIRNLLRDVEGLSIRIVGPKVVIEGELLVPADYGRLLTVITDKAYADYVMNLATLSPLALQLLAKRIQDDVNTFAPNVRTRVVNGVIFLEGTTDSIDSARRAVQLAELYLPEFRPSQALEKLDPAVKALARPPVKSFIVVNAPPQKKEAKLIRVLVHFVELSKDYNKIFGFKWMPGFTADPTITIGQTQAGATNAGGPSFTATISSLLPKLMSAQTAGYARVLKTGTVVVRSGLHANLVEQTQYPFTQAGAMGQVTAAEQPVGLSIDVLPEILGQGDDIRMHLKMEQSNVVGKAPANNAPPIVATHKVETDLYVKSNESAAVAGVNSSDVGTNFNTDDPSPGQFDANTDPLFTLKHTKNYLKQKSQFVIFVTPQIIDSASSGTGDLQKNFRVNVR